MPNSVELGMGSRTGISMESLAEIMRQRSCIPLKTKCSCSLFPWARLRGSAGVWGVTPNGQDGQVNGGSSGFSRCLRCLSTLIKPALRKGLRKRELRQTLFAVIGRDARIVQASERKSDATEGGPAIHLKIALLSGSQR